VGEGEEPRLLALRARAAERDAPARQPPTGTTVNAPSMQLESPSSAEVDCAAADVELEFRRDDAMVAGRWAN
jgi:hypothetical protein